MATVGLLALLGAALAVLVFRPRPDALDLYVCGQCLETLRGEREARWHMSRVHGSEATVEHLVSCASGAAASSVPTLSDTEKQQQHR